MKNTPIKYSLFFLLALYFSLAVVAQNQATNIKTQAMEMAKALLNKDNTAFVKFMHPRVVEMAGGREKLLQTMDTVNAGMKKMGAEIKKVLIGNPATVISYKGTLQTTLPQVTSMTFMMGEVELESTLIAISADAGKNWYFIDTAVYPADKLKKSVPDLSPHLVIPPMKPPTFIQQQ